MRRVLGALVLVLPGCPVTSDPLCERDVCVASAADAGPTPIDPCVETPTTSRCLDEASALFVNRGGSQTGNGTRANPFASIKQALEAVQPQRRRIYVCDGRYEEDLLFTGKHDSASVIGGIDCAWNASNAKPVIGLSANPVVVNASRGLALASVAIQAADATIGSSIALRVIRADITIKNVALTAGSGAAGAAATIVDHVYPAKAVLDGIQGVGSTGGQQRLYMACEEQAGVPTIGGKGGDSGNSGESGMPDHPGTGGTGGTVNACDSGGRGVPGEDGPPGAKGSGAPRIGVFKDDQWMPEAGEKGGAGRVAQGGGGGAGLLGSGGGGGGAGGCGGAGASGGGGGGASVAMASLFSTVNVLASVLHAKNGGRGGDGRSGQDGQSGGDGGLPSTTNACNGARGGTGGRGGAGGGGAGGVSTGVLYTGPRPILDAASGGDIRIGAGGDPGAGPEANDGVRGRADNVIDTN